MSSKRSNTTNKRKSRKPRRRRITCVFGILWSVEEESSRQHDRSHGAARALVAALKSTPQPTTDPVTAVAARPAQLRLTQSPCPLSFEELDETFIFDGEIPEPSTIGRPRRRTAFRAASNGRATTASRGSPVSENGEDRRAPVLPTAGEPEGDPTRKGKEASSNRGGKREGTGVNHRRPGRGGRQPRVTAHNETTATAELLSEIGPPQEEPPVKGTKLWWWRHEGGRGISFARLSGQEIHEGETVMSQVHANRRMFRELGLEPLYTVVTLNNTAARPYAERPDFHFLEERLAAGEIDWIAARDLDRLLRNDLAQAILFDLLRRTKTGLYLARFGRKMDWSRDKLLLQTLGNIGEHERDMTRERTAGSIISRYVAEGRGRPGSARFGFYRDPMTKELVVDPEQWPLVKLLHYRYDELGGTRGGLRRVRDELKEAGCEFTISYLSTMLKDPIYVTGEFVTRLGDRLVTCKPVPLTDPIPADVFERNQEHLAQNRGPHQITPPGYFCLNAIPVIHAACADETVDYQNAERVNTTQPRLRGRIYRDRPNSPPTYTHAPRPPEGCKGYSIDADALERAVLEQLLRLASSRELQQEWASAVPIKTVEDSPILTDEERAALQGQIRQLEAKKRSLEDELVQRILDDKPATNADHARLVGPVEEKIAQLKRRLEIAETMAKRKFRAETDPAVKALLEAGAINEEEEDDLLAALREILTLERPAIDDDDLLRRRAAVVQAALSAVIIHDLDDGIALELQGPLVPDDAELVRPIGPIESARELLEAHVAEKRNSEDSDRGTNGTAGAADDEQTVEQDQVCSTVCAKADSPTALDLLAARDVLPHDEVEDLYFSNDRPLTPESWEDRPLHPHRRGRNPQRMKRHQYARPAGASRPRGLTPRLTAGSAAGSRLSGRPAGVAPAWCSPPLSLQLTTRRALSAEKCLRPIIEVAKSLDDPGSLTITAYDDIAENSPDLPRSSVLVRRANHLGLARGWPELRDLAYADEPGLRDSHGGSPLPELARELDRPVSTLRNASEKGRLRTYHRFGRIYSTRAWVEDYFRTRKIGRPRR